MKKNLLLISFLVSTFFADAQNVSINNNGSAPDPSAMLDISSNSKGLLIPRMSKSQRINIANPKTGLIVYDSSNASFWFYQKNQWQEIAGRTINSDSALIYGQQTGTIPSYNMTGFGYADDSTGYLYDGGGPNGNYGNNQDYLFRYHPDFPGAIGVRFQVISNDLESPYDSLMIYTQGASSVMYGLTGTQTGTYIFNSGLDRDIYIRFKTNSVNTAPGFKIRWDVIFAPASTGTNVIPLTGWYFEPEKIAMHGGLNLNDRWSLDSTGIGTFNYGFGNLAKGEFSTAFGNMTRATGSYSLSTGWSTLASGRASTSLGIRTTSSGDNSFASGYYSTSFGFAAAAMGDNTRAFGHASTALGYETTASGSYSTAMGFRTLASGLGSTAMGNHTEAIGWYSTAMGNRGQANAEWSVVIGDAVTANSWISTTLGRHNDPIVTSPTYSWVLTEPLLIVGNGTGTGDRKNAMVILKNGNVGLAENNPFTPLTFANSFGNKISLAGTVANHYGLGVESNLMQIYSNNAVANIAFGYKSGGTFTERMRIMGNGNVGIGESIPYTPLSFANTLGDKISFSGTAADHSGFGVQSDLLQMYSNGALSDIAFGYRNGGTFTEKMRIKGNGFVGIGNSNPGFILDVSGRMRLRSGGTVSNESGLWLNNLSNIAPHFFIGMQDDDKVGFFGNGGIGWGLTMERATGNVNITGKVRFFMADCINGFCPPNGSIRLTPNLHLNAMAGYAGMVNWDNGVSAAAEKSFRVGNGNFNDVFYVTYGGNAWLAGTLTQASDSRLKKDIIPLSNSLQKITQLNGYNYYWKNQRSDNSLQTGVLAQEVKKLFPELVKEDKEGMLSVNYSGLIPVLIESIKEQQKQNDKQQKQNDKQQQQIIELEKEILWIKEKLK